MVRPSRPGGVSLIAHLMIAWGGVMVMVLMAFSMFIFPFYVMTGHGSDMGLALLLLLTIGVGSILWGIGLLRQWRWTWVLVLLYAASFVFGGVASLAVLPTFTGDWWIAVAFAAGGAVGTLYFLSRRVRRFFRVATVEVWGR